ncbi:MAG TPA: phage major capsid protein [Dissulfurispiraceae bacterium]|jgi:HK97 family phage major capsid protein|nr:phage major capsid protein [Dissulfurispiraceae bacterium]
MTLKEMIERRNAIYSTEIDNAKTDAELDALQTELRKLGLKIAEEEKRQEPAAAPSAAQKQEDTVSERTKAVNSEIPAIVTAAAKGQEQRKCDDGDMEKRAEQLANDLRSGKEVSITADLQSYLEKRAITTANVMLESKYKREIAESFSEVAQTIDLVDSFSLNGGNSYDVSFQITDGDADYTEEGATYTSDEGTFGTASTGRAKITNSAVVNEEVVALPNADYLTRIIASVRRSIRKKISHQIIAGLGGLNQLRGILNAPVGTIPATYKVGVAAIDRDTLRRIVFAHGGDEDVESPATLFLNKLDLAAFAAVMAAGDGRPYYKVEYNGASGFIQESGGGLRVPYTINSACPALSAVATVVGTKTMVYGSPMSYELPMFTPLSIKRSDERFIDQGKIGFFGKVIVGGVVNRYKGFIPVEKVTAV